jgi:hypothetical protein
MNSEMAAIAASEVCRAAEPAEALQHLRPLISALRSTDESISAAQAHADQEAKA